MYAIILFFSSPPIFSRGLATLKEALSVRPSVRPSVRWSVRWSVRHARVENARNAHFTMLQLSLNVCGCMLVCGKGVWARLGVGCPCPPVRNDIVTPASLVPLNPVNTKFFLVIEEYNLNVFVHPSICNYLASTIYLYSRMFADAFFYDRPKQAQDRASLSDGYAGAVQQIC